MAIFQQGMGQMTPAIQALLRNVTRAPGRSSRRAKSKRGSARTASSKKRSTRSSKRTTKKSRSSSSRGKAHLVKGSAAAKRYMAKIRKMRK